MPLICGCIMPHGDEIVRELVGELDEKSRRLADAMEALAKELFELKPDTIVIATPHNLRILKHIGIIHTSYASGTWSSDKGSISVEVECDRDFAESIYQEAEKAGIPVVLVDYGVSEGKLSNMCLDWGTIIPLWFIKKEFERHNATLPKLVLVTPSREIDWDYLVSFGEAIHRVSETSSKKIAFIASADQGHAHDPNGPYGYDKASEEFDQFVVQIVKENKLERLLELDPQFIERAKPDSFWQMLILYGAIKDKSFRSRLVVYECPTYFGMLVAMFR